MAANEDKIVIQGQVTNLFPGTKFEVTTDNGHKITATLSGKLKVHQIRILMHDKVDVEVSAYDLERGRIIWRYR